VGLADIESIEHPELCYECPKVFEIFRFPKAGRLLAMLKSLNHSTTISWQSLDFRPNVSPDGPVYEASRPRLKGKPKSAFLFHAELSKLRII
jgi:hypothetical protein